MVDPTNLVRPLSNCSEFALFACCVQGKMAKIQAEKFNNAIEILYEMFPNYDNQPFSCLRALTDDELHDLLCSVRMGQYGRILKSWRFLSDSFKDQDKMTVNKLENGFGIGPKTSRFIVAYCYDLHDVAILDTHVLSFLKRKGIPNIPDNTPQDRQVYAQLERVFLDMAKEQGVHPLDFDTQIWNEASK